MDNIISFQPNFNQLIDSRGGPQTVQCHNDCVKDINELWVINVGNSCRYGAVDKINLKVIKLKK